MRFTTTREGGRNAGGIILVDWSAFLLLSLKDCVVDINQNTARMPFSFFFFVETRGAAEFLRVSVKSLRTCSYY